MNTHTRRRFLTDLLFAGGAIALVAGLATTMGTTKPAPSSPTPSSPTPLNPTAHPMAGEAMPLPATPSPSPKKIAQPIQSFPGAVAHPRSVGPKIKSPAPSPSPPYCDR